MRSLIYHGETSRDELVARLEGCEFLSDPEEGHVEVVWSSKREGERVVWERLELLKKLLEEGVMVGAVSYGGEVREREVFFYWEGLFIDGVVEGWVGTQVDRRLMGEVYVDDAVRAMYELGEREEVASVRRVEAGRLLQQFFEEREGEHLHIWAEAGMGKTTLLDDLLRRREGCGLLEFDVVAGSDRRWWERWTGGEVGGTLEGLVAVLDEGLRAEGVSVLVVDNFQWIDAQSLRMLEILYEVRKGSRDGGLRLVTLGRRDLEGGSPLVDEAGYVSHGLAGFGLDEVEQLMALAGVAGDGVAEAVLLYSGGHPLLVTELVGNPGVLRRLRDEGGVDGEGDRGRFEVLLEAIFEKNPELREVGEGDLKDLVRLVAESRVRVSLKGLEELIGKLGMGVDVEDFVGLDFVGEVGGRYGFRHDFYRQCLMAVMDVKGGLEKLAEVLEGEGEAAEAGRLWDRCGEGERAAEQYLEACRRADVSEDFGRMGVWAELGEKAEGGHVRSFLFYRGKAELRVGVLGEASELMRRYLEGGNVYPRRRWLMLYGLFFVRTRWNGSWLGAFKGRNVREGKKDVEAYGAMIEFLGIAGDVVETLEYLIGYFLVAAEGEGDDGALAEIYGLLAIVYQPVLGAGGVRRFQLESLRRSQGAAREVRLSARFLRFHLRMHEEGWRRQVGIGRRLVESGVERRDYRNAARACLEYSACLLCLDLHEEAEGFLDRFLGDYGGFLPEWFKGWFEAVRCGIWIDCCEPARVLMSRDGAMEDELQGGRHLFYAAAEMGMGNVEKAKEHYLEALGLKEQLRVNHHAFSLCLAIFCEVGLFLYQQGELERGEFKQTRKMMKVQRKSVWRSRSMVDGYLALDLIFCGKVERGMKGLRRAWEQAGERGEQRAQRLLGYHLEMSGGALTASPEREGMQARVRRLWGCLEEERLLSIQANFERAASSS